MTEISEMTWDLSVLFKNFEDPAITQTLESVKNDTINFERDYKGKINNLSITAEKLNVIISQFENIQKQLLNVRLFANLSVNADSKNKDALILQNTYENTLSIVKKKFVFFYLELGLLLADKGASFLNNIGLEDKKHFLEKVLRKQPYRLDEEQEKLIIEKNLFGKQAWSQIQKQWLSTRKFTLNIKGEEKVLSWSSGMGFFYDADREVRREAITKILGSLGKDQELFASALRNVCGDHVIESKRRGYPTTMESSIIENDINQKMLDNMFEVLEKNIDLFQEFLLLKAKILGTEKLLGEDFWAPLPFEDKRLISWSKAKQLVLEGFQRFDDDFGVITRNMFDNHRIDSAPRSTKRAGAFCASWYDGQSAFIMQSFNGKMSNIITLAHEMGHAVHAHLASAKQTYINLRAPMVLAETASEFGKMFFIDKIIKEAPTDDIRKSILFNHLQRIFNVVFEVGSRTRFEEKLYKAVENGTYLSADKITELFWEARNLYFGDTVKWLPEQAYHWCWKPHYYMHDIRFYNYPYVFGELLVLA
ncbi:MAG: M3 family metallopeptidase, partial [Candidatus Hodarchaeales archaeon]